MATVAEVEPNDDVIVLRRVPYKVYARLADEWANRHLEMTYSDGALEIMSPITGDHEQPSDRLRIVVTAVADVLGMEYEGTGGRTFRRGGEGIFKGKGKQPDQSFYFASVDRLPSGRRIDLDAGDPAPDLWLEVDHRASSIKRMPIYADLGVPEVWRYKTEPRSLKFLRLMGDHYESMEQSLALPALTPPLVLEALQLGEGVLESEFTRRLRRWIVERFGPRPVGE